MQHETVKIEMASKQHELDQLSSKGKQLVIELKKIPDCDAQIMKKDKDTLVDRWLDVSCGCAIKSFWTTIMSKSKQ